MTENAVSIYHGNASGKIESYQATVKSYYQNNRSTKLPALRSEYRLSLKMINDQLFVRIDLDANASPDKVARAILTAGTETVVLNTNTGKVEQRITLPESQNRLALLNNTLQSVGRLNLDNLKAIARKLSLDISDATPGLLQLTIPAATLPTMPNKAQVSSYKLSFDSTESVLVNSEMVIAEEDGTTVTVTTTPIYQEDNGELIKVGEQVVNAYHIPGKLDVSDAATQAYATADDIPTLTADELAALQAGGTVSTSESEVILGDLSDASYTETQLMVYEEVKLNTLADSLFRMNF